MAASLYGKVCDFQFAWVAILVNQIAGEARKMIVLNVTLASFTYFDHFAVGIFKKNLLTSGCIISGCVMVDIILLSGIVIEITTLTSNGD